MQCLSKNKNKTFNLFKFVFVKRFELKKKDFLKSSVFATAFVTKPAIEVGLVYLNSDKVPSYNVKLEKGIAYSPVLIPNQYIPRVNEETNEEFEVYFTEETIEELSQDYMKAGAVVMQNFNNQHNENQKLEGVSVVENWIIEDPENDKSTKLGFKLPKGTWMQGIKIEDETIKQKIRDKEYFGISIEGDFNHLLKLKSQHSIFDEMNKIKEQISSLALKLSGSSTKEKFASVTTNEEVTLYFDGEELEPNKALFVDAEMTTAAPVGMHTLSDGRMIEVAEGGVVTAIKEIETAEEFDKETVEQIGAVTVSNAEKIEQLQKENTQLKSEIAGFTEKFKAIENTIGEHTTKLSKVQVPESVTKLSEQKSSTLTNYLANRKTF